MGKTTPMFGAQQQGPEMETGRTRPTIHHQNGAKTKSATKSRERFATTSVMTPHGVDQTPTFEQRTSGMIGKGDKTRARMLTVQMQQSRDQYQTRAKERSVW